ncbi:hypothetical protein, variant 1 [Aphanomyces invadans]|uniref:Vacuolar membrane-associated protein Iml1 N-terminal domain-containing protein n=1 Tax=Aphanomyces invadans TaxID=157072 RepID=A0A024TXE5_9STRA|nr:hypothetical protein H310_08770 [Aphanomyces invadans]XP_008872856.1 hypothetical protein, variant 1 [Aphanomyces invadans]ETV98658.1 hypothetical protein H310_08770 [Aphanomyces invadans]ETV98659.1 hypothetical protein, variant 1 [Aphanomyces invadans]|eukprot:XP_008872855.1 hypothetical protein H310_08770 [Aphanomyces invadans]
MNRRRWTRPAAKDAAAVPSATTAANKTIDSVKRKTKDRAIVKLHVHGLEFHGGEELVLNLDALKQDLTFPEDDAYVMEIFTPNCTEDSRQHLLMDVPSPDELRAKKPVKGKMQLSLLKDTAAQFNLQLLQDVVVRFVEKHVVEVEFVEVSLKDQFLSRRDLFYLQRSLVGKALYVGKMVRMHGARVQVMELVHENDSVVTGVVTAKTRFVFRSKSSRIFWLVQISPEMWDMGNNGNLYADELIRMVSSLFDRWQADYVSHSLTVILFGRNYYDELPPLHSEHHSNAISQDDDGHWFEDFYKVISYGRDGALDTAAMLTTLKAEVNAFPHLCGWGLDPIKGIALTCKGGHGHPSSAKDGNVLEAINLILNIYEKHYLDRDLNRSGQNLVLFTAGNGVFRVNQLVSDMTEQRMMDNGIGFDCISLSSPPLESVPRFYLKGPTPLTHPSGRPKQPLKLPMSPFSLSECSSSFTPMWFSVRFSQHTPDTFSPLPMCRLFAAPVGMPSRPLAFLLTQLQWTPHQTLTVPTTPTTPFALPFPSTPDVAAGQLQLQQLKPYYVANDCDDDVFVVRSTPQDKSPPLHCGTPPLHSLQALVKQRKASTKNFGMSPDMKPAAFNTMVSKSPRQQPFSLAGGGQARSFPTSSSSSTSPHDHHPSPRHPGVLQTMHTSMQQLNPAALPHQHTHHRSSSSGALHNPPAPASQLRSTAAVAYAPVSTANKYRWSHVYRYEMLSYELDFKSLCTPALLPLTTDYMQDFNVKYEEKVYKVGCDQHDGGGFFLNHREYALELVAQRFSQDFQLIGERHVAGTTMYKLSMGHQVHEISYSDTGEDIDVKILKQTTPGEKAKAAMPSLVPVPPATTPRVEYNYSLWSPLTSHFLPAKQEFRYPNTDEYGWNTLDSSMSAHDFVMTNNIKYKRGLYCVLPPVLSTHDDADRQKTLDEFTDRFTRFLDYIRMKARKDDGSIAATSPLLTNVMDVNILSGERIPRRVVQSDIKIPLSAPDAPLQQQWLNIHYDVECLPVQVYHIEVQWLVCRSALVDDFILGLQRRAKQFNLDVIPMPENCGVSTMDVHPLICPVFFPLKSAADFAVVEHKLTSELQFCLEGIHRIPYESMTYQYHGPTKATSAGLRSVSGKTRAPQRTYRQFIHRSMSCFVRLTDAGVIWISSRRMHSAAMQTLFCQLKHVVQTISVTDEMKKLEFFQTASVVITPPLVPMPTMLDDVAENVCLSSTAA